MGEVSIDVPVYNFVLRRQASVMFRYATSSLRGEQQSYEYGAHSINRNATFDLHQFLLPTLTRTPQNESLNLGGLNLELEFGQNGGRHSKTLYREVL